MRAICLFILIGLAPIVSGLEIKINHPSNSDYNVTIGPFDSEQRALSYKESIQRYITSPVTSVTDQRQSSWYLTLKSFGSLDKAQSLKKTLNKQMSNQGRVWNLRNADIRAVIDEVARVTGKNFIIDPRVQGKVSIVSSTPLTNRELYQVFLSMLQVSGYIAIPTDKAIKILPNIEARSQAIINQSHPQGEDYQVEVVPVHFVPAEQIVPVLRPLMPQWSNISAYAPSNMLILSGTADKVQQLASIIKQVDSSSANGIDMVPLRYALAMDIVNTLKDMVKTQPQSGLHAQTMLAADDRNNSVLISGSKTERLKMRVLIQQLDKESPFGKNSQTQVIYLHYLRAQDLVPILAGIAQASFSGNVGTTIGTITTPDLDSTNPASNFAQLGGTQQNPMVNPGSVSANAAPETQNTSNETEGSTKPSVQIIGEPNTNSIIISAPSTVTRMLKNVISQLDIKPAQILIEALVAEVNESDVKRLGIEWGSVVESGENNASTFRPGFAILNTKAKLDQFEAQIHALAEKRRANILSTPSVVVLDNRQAKILIGKQLSVATTSFPNNAGGGTVASPFTTFDRINVALHLYVRPQITRGNGIQMQIDQGNDTIDPATTISLNQAPVFNISAIVTSVHVDSGDTLILGGLKQDSLAQDNNRLAILGDVPGLGQLFQRNNNNREKKILMVFIRPCILRSKDDNLMVTGSKYYDVRQQQLSSMRLAPEYKEDNKDVILPPFQQATLPRPFVKTIDNKRTK